MSLLFLFILITPFSFADSLGDYDGLSFKNFIAEMSDVIQDATSFGCSGRKIIFASPTNCGKKYCYYNVPYDAGCWTFNEDIRNSGGGSGLIPTYGIKLEVICPQKDCGDFKKCWNAKLESSELEAFSKTGGFEVDGDNARQIIEEQGGSQ